MKGWYSEGEKLALSLVDMWEDKQKLVGYLKTVIEQYKEIDNEGREEFIRGAQAAVDKTR